MAVLIRQLTGLCRPDAELAVAGGRTRLGAVANFVHLRAQLSCSLRPVLLLKNPGRDTSWRASCRSLCGSLAFFSASP